MKRVFAVLPTLASNVPRLNDAINSVRENTDPATVDLIVINNSGSKKIEGLLGADSVVNPGLNLGYVGAIELARRLTDSEFLWVLQDDMLLWNDVLSALLDEMDSDLGLAAVSPLLVRDGVVPMATRGGVFTNPAQTKWRNVPFKDVPLVEWETIDNLSFVSGSGALFRTQALEEVGGFDVSLFPLMHVDVDVCARLVRRGFGIALAPRAHIKHEIQGSTPKILSEVLTGINSEIVTSKLEQRFARDQFDADSVPIEIIENIAAKASTLVLSLSTLADTRITELQDELGSLRDQNTVLEVEVFHARNLVDSMRRTLSWKITKPLRLARSIVTELWRTR